MTENEELMDSQDSGSTQKILVADDEASIRRILETRLKMIGYEVVTADDGEEAVAAFNGNEELYLSNELEEMAKIAQENANELSTDPDVGLIEKYIKTPIPTDWDSRNIDQRRIYLRYGLSPQDAGIPLCHRTKVCSKEILHECYEMSKGDRECPALTRKINRILRSFDFLEEGKSDKGVPQHVLFSLYGRQQPYYIKARNEDTIQFEE